MAHLPVGRVTCEPGSDLSTFGPCATSIPSTQSCDWWPLFAVQLIGPRLLSSGTARGRFTWELS